VLGQETLWSRQILTKHLGDEKISLTPIQTKGENPAYEMTATFRFGRFFSGILCPNGVGVPNARQLEPDHDLVEGNGRAQACGLTGF